MATLQISLISDLRSLAAYLISTQPKPKASHSLNPALKPSFGKEKSQAVVWLRGFAAHK